VKGNRVTDTLLEELLPAKFPRVSLLKGRKSVIFNEEAGQLLLEEPEFHLIVFDSQTEEILQWKH
jgi:hypothetical protein